MANMADVQGSDWKSPMYRNQIVTRIDQAMRTSGGSFPIRGDATQVESYIFERSTTFPVSASLDASFFKEEYMHDVGRVMLMSKGQSQQSQQQMSSSVPLQQGSGAMCNQQPQLQQSFQDASMMNRMPLRQNAPMGPSQRFAQQPQQALPSQGGMCAPPRQAVLAGGMSNAMQQPNVVVATSSPGMMDQSSFPQRMPINQAEMEQLIQMMSPEIRNKYASVAPQHRLNFLMQFRNQRFATQQQHLAGQAQQVPGPRQFRMAVVPQQPQHMTSPGGQMHSGMMPQSLGDAQPSAQVQPLQQYRQPVPNAMQAGPGSSSIAVLQQKATPLYGNSPQTATAIAGPPSNLPAANSQQPSMNTNIQSPMPSGPGSVAPVSFQVPSPGFPPGPSPGNCGPPSVGIASRPPSELCPSPSAPPNSFAAGPPSVASVSSTSAAPSSVPSNNATVPKVETVAADDTAYRDKIKELQHYLAPLKKALGEKEQLSMQKLHRIVEILEGRSKTNMEVLLKCEALLKNLFAKTEVHESSLCQPLLDSVAQLVKQSNANAVLRHVFASWMPNQQQIQLPNFAERSENVASKRFKADGYEENANNTVCKTASGSPSSHRMPVLVCQGADDSRLQCEDAENAEALQAVGAAAASNGEACSRASDADDPSSNAAAALRKVSHCGSVPELLVREAAALEPRFRINVDSSLSTVVPGKTVAINCDLGSVDLPFVPSLKLIVPHNYPTSVPRCDPCQLLEYSGSRFLDGIQKALSNRITKLGSMTTVTSILEAWENCVRQACLTNIPLIF